VLPDLTQPELGGTQLCRRVEVISSELDVRYTLDDVHLAPTALSLGDADDEGASIGIGKGSQRRGERAGPLIRRLEFEELALVVFFD
jgi:hypothetical protein